MKKLEKARIEKMYLWLGASLGIIVSTLTIYDHFNQNSAPNLVVNFSYNSSTQLNYVPDFKTDSVSLNYSFPFDIKIENNGDLTAQNIELRIICPESILLVSDKYSFESDKIIINTKKMNIFSFHLSKINPNSFIQTLNSIHFTFSTNIIDQLNKKNSKQHCDSLIFGKYNLQCMLSCDNVKAKETELKLVIKDTSYFETHGLSYYLLKNDEIYIITNEYL